VLGDSAESPRFIETVARRGYRFLADVVVIDEPPQIVATEVVSKHGVGAVSPSGLASQTIRYVNAWSRMIFLPFAIFADLPEHFPCCVAFTVTASVSTNVHRKSVLIPRGRSFICWIRMFR
jgi:hypothetical protein